jgi:hypothetical protein
VSAHFFFLYLSSLTIHTHSFYANVLLHTVYTSFLSPLLSHPSTFILISPQNMPIQSQPYHYFFTGATFKLPLIFIILSILVTPYIHFSIRIFIACILSLLALVAQHSKPLKTTALMIDLMLSLCRHFIHLAFILFLPSLSISPSVILNQ